MAPTTLISAIFAVYGGFRAFNYQSQFPATIAFGTDERPTAQIFAERLGASPEDFLFGIHVFFDLLNSYFWGTLENPWLEDTSGFPVNYPPLVMLALKFIAFGPYKSSAIIVLAVMAVCIVLPMVLAFARHDKALMLLAAGVALVSGPAIASLDRGNIQGFIPVLLFGFGYFVLKGNWGWASVFLITAGSIKLFPMLILILYVSERRWRALAGTVIVFLAVNAFAFLAFPGSWWESARTWFGYAAGFVARPDIADFLSHNSSFAGGLAHWSLVLGSPGTAEAIFANARIIGIAVFIVLALVVFMRDTLPLVVRIFVVFMASSVALPAAYPYTSNWIIAASALLFWSAYDVHTAKDSGAPYLQGDEVPPSPSRLGFSSLALSAALLLAFAPVFIPGTVENGYPTGIAALLTPVAVLVTLIGLSQWAVRARFSSHPDLATAR